MPNKLNMKFETCRGPVPCSHGACVRKLDILMFDLIQKITYNTVVAYICTCVILSLLRLEINIAKTTATTADILKMKNNRLRLYPEEGPVPKAPAAPFTLVDIVCCLK